MAEVPSQGAPTPQAAPEAQPSAQPSGLDKVYQDFGIEDTASTFQPQSPQPAQQTTQPQPPAAPKVPDPFDPNFQQYQAQIANGVSSLHQQLQSTQQKLSQMEANMARRQTEADIKQAVGLITEKAGIEPDIAEVALEAKARQDPRFLKIWNNRSANPKAFQAALAAVAGEFQQKFTVRQDPQLVENQRAVKAAQQQMATTQKPSQQDEWAGMTPGERQAKVRMLINSGG
jgi:hypothetical protein